LIDKQIIETKINSGYNKILSVKNNSGSIDFVKTQIKSAKQDFYISNILLKPFLLLPTNDVKNGYYVIK
jgi:hypothetical protein